MTTNLSRVAALGLALAACSGKDIPAVGSDPSDPLCVAPAEGAEVLPAVAYEQAEIDGWPVVQWIPDDPVGLLFYFHGAGGNAQQVLQTEPVRAVNVFVTSGFALAATQSDQRGDDGQWSGDEGWGESPDFVRLDAIRAGLIASGGVTADTPVFAMGFSNGGGFSAVFGDAAREEGWPVAAVSVHNAGGYGADDDLPLSFVVAENETATTVEAAQAQYDERAAGGLPALFNLTEEQPVDATRFTRIPGFTEELSANAYTELQTFGLIDADGARIPAIEDVESELLRFENNARIFKAWEVVAQLRVLWATHRYDSAFAAEECSFFLDAL